MLAKAPKRRHYRIKLSGRTNQPYKADEIDFLVAYIFAEDIWYVFPVTIIENQTMLCISLGLKRSRLEPYREAWNLMGTNEPALPNTKTIAAAAPGT